MNWMNRLLRKLQEGDSLKNAVVKYPTVLKEQHPYDDPGETPYLIADYSSYVLENIVHAEEFMNKDWEYEHEFHVTVWTENWIYFTVHSRYGFHFESVPRNPSLKDLPSVYID